MNTPPPPPPFPPPLINALVSLLNIFETIVFIFTNSDRNLDIFKPGWLTWKAINPIKPYGRMWTKKLSYRLVSTTTFSLRTDQKFRTKLINACAVRTNYVREKTDCLSESRSQFYSLRKRNVWVRRKQH